MQARESSLFQSCSLPSTSLRQSSLTARGRKLYALRMASGYLETLFHLYKNPVYIGKTAGYRIDSCYVEGIRNKEFRHPRRVSHNTIDTVEIERAFCHDLSDAVRQGFVKVTTVFSYNRRCHSFSYSSSRLDPHSDYRCFLIGREKPLCIFSLLSTSLRQSSLTARGRKLYVLRMASGYLETLFHLYKNPVYIGKTAGYRIDSCYVEGIRNR